MSDVSGMIMLPEEAVHTASGAVAYKDEVAQCVECVRLGLEDTYWLLSEVEHRSETGAALCRKHAAVCSITGKTLATSEIVKLRSGKVVDRRLTAECVVCAGRGHRIRYLKSEMREYRRNKYLCRKHAVKSDVTGKYIPTTQSRRLADGRIVEKELARECRLCAKEGRPDSFHLKEEMVQATGKRGGWYCKEHIRLCWVCGRMLPDEKFDTPVHILKPMCEDCHDAWVERMVESIGERGVPCGLCGFVNQSEQKKGKCPECGHKTLQKEEDSPLREMLLQELQHVSPIPKDIKYRVYRRSHYRRDLILLVEKKFFGKKRWWLFHDDELVATNTGQTEES